MFLNLWRLDVDFLFVEDNSKSWKDLRDFMLCICQTVRTHLGYYNPDDSDHYGGNIIYEIQSGNYEGGMVEDDYEEKDRERMAEFFNSFEWANAMDELNNNPKPRYLNNLLRSLKSGKNKSFHPGITGNMIKIIESALIIVKNSFPSDLHFMRDPDSVMDYMDIMKLDIQAFGLYQDNRDAMDQNEYINVYIHQTTPLYQKPNKSSLSYVRNMEELAYEFYQLNQIILDNNIYKNRKWKKITL